MSVPMTQDAALNRLTHIAQTEETLRREKPAAIEAAIKAGCERMQIAAALGCTRQALYNYLARRR